MKKENIRFPDACAVDRILTQNQGTAAELILRLAWDAGLSRDEICSLKWENVDFLRRQLVLPNRSIPIDEALLSCLELNQELHRNDSNYVVISDRLHKPMMPESVSRIARLAMNAEPVLLDMRLTDLRHGFIHRQLQHSDWRYVARISGISVRTMQTLFLPDALDRVNPSPAESTVYDEQRIQYAIETAESPVIALALRLIWDLGLQAQQCISLTWEQIRWDHQAIALSEQEIPIPPKVLQQLQTLYEHRASGNPHILLTSKSQAQYSLSGLSKEIRTVLIRAGVDATLQDLLRDRWKDSREEQILQLAREKKQLTRQDLIRTFHLTTAQANLRLRRLTESGKLVRIGTTYYLAGAVVPPSQQYQVVQDHLQASGVAYRKGLAELLGIGVRQCGWILHKWVREGKLAIRGQLYTLPELPQ